MLLRVVEKGLGSAHTIGPADVRLDALEQPRELGGDVLSHSVVALSSQLARPYSRRELALAGLVPALDAAHLRSELPLGRERGARALVRRSELPRLPESRRARLLRELLLSSNARPEVGKSSGTHLRDPRAHLLAA